MSKVESSRCLAGVKGELGLRRGGSSLALDMISSRSTFGQGLPSSLLLDSLISTIQMLDSTKELYHGTYIILPQIPLVGVDCRPHANQSESPAWLRQRPIDSMSANIYLVKKTDTHHQVLDPILGVKLDTNLIPQAGLPSIKTARLDASHVRHDLELGVKATAAVGATTASVDQIIVQDPDDEEDPR